MAKSSEELCFAADSSKRLSTESQKNENKKLSVQETIALYLDLVLSERKYNVLRSVVNALHKDCFPSLHSTKKAKASYLPSRKTIKETSAAIDLQEILNKTIKHPQ